MKKTLTLFVLILGLVSANAQEQPTFQKNQFNILHSFQPDSYRNLDFTFGYERWFNNEVSIGINFNYYQGKDYPKFIPEYNVTRPRTYDQSLGLSLSINYDWSKMMGLDTSKFDFYTGVSWGRSRMNYTNLYQITSDGITTLRADDDVKDVLIFGGKIGARYWITKNIGVNLEIDKSFETIDNDNLTRLNLGVNFKF